MDGAGERFRDRMEHWEGGAGAAARGSAARLQQLLKSLESTIRVLASPVENRIPYRQAVSSGQRPRDWMRRRRRLKTTKGRSA
ncbi:MAG TPA: hypothetical protein PLG18_03575, partial [Syntrophales bacterium]|nr:hypothetical protein [Syntrophales bacterium]